MTAGSRVAAPLRWLGRAVLLWFGAVAAGLALAGVAFLLGLEEVASRPLDDFFAFTLVFAWLGLPVYLAVVWWRSGRPGLRAWTVLASPLIYVATPYVWLPVAVGPAHLGVVLSAVLYGAVVPPAPRRRA